MANEHQRSPRSGQDSIDELKEVIAEQRRKQENLRYVYQFLSSPQFVDLRDADLPVSDDPEAIAERKADVEYRIKVLKSLVQMLEEERAALERTRSVHEASQDEAEARGDAPAETASGEGAADEMGSAAGATPLEKGRTPGKKATARAGARPSATPGRTKAPRAEAAGPATAGKPPVKQRAPKKKAAPEATAEAGGALRPKSAGPAEAPRTAAAGKPQAGKRRTSKKAAPPAPAKSDTTDASASRTDAAEPPAESKRRTRKKPAPKA